VNETILGNEAPTAGHCRDKAEAACRDLSSSLQHSPLEARSRMAALSLNGRRQALLACALPIVNLCRYGGLRISKIIDLRNIDSMCRINNGR
jgi:hypothetical protein